MIKATYVRPDNRDFMRNVYCDQQYSSTEKNLYRTGYMKLHFEGIGLYQATEFEKVVEYLERDANGNLYFTIDGKVYFVFESIVEFVENTNDATRVGSSYQLVDVQLTELGFVAQSKVFFDYFKVPNTMADKEFDADSVPTVLQHKDIVAKWVTPS